MGRTTRLKSERREKKRQKARYAPKGGTLAATRFKIGVNKGYVRRKASLRAKRSNPVAAN